MADRSLLYRIRAALQGGFVAVGSEVELLATFSGVISGVNNIEAALQRFDGTGVGAAIFRFTGAFSAQLSNIDDWFGGKQLVRLRCTDPAGATGAVRFDLPGTSALNTAFDQLVAAGLPEVITFVIEYTGSSAAFLQIFPRVSPSPQISGTSSIVVRSGVAATVEITRDSGTLSEYIFQSIGGIGNGGNISADSIKLINPTSAVWDASANGPLPSSGVVKGNAYRVVNAPSDGSGRFGETMQNDDWVVWEGETFTAWSNTPVQWFVLPAHDVRRITALEQDFLTGLSVSAVSDRNTIIRGANYADTAGELRLKIYTTEAGYSAADLNTTGDIDEYTNPSDITGILGIRLDQTSANLTDPALEDLYVYTENSDGTFVLLGNMARDFAFRGDFGGESDYTSINNVVYTTGQTIRIYIGEALDRFNAPNLDITESNLSDAVQQKLNREATGGVNDEHRIASLESKVAALFPLTPDVEDLTEFAAIFTPAQTAQIVDITPGYSLLADYRGDSTRYESSGVTYDNTGTNVVRYTGLTENMRRAFGFKVTAPANQVLMWIVDGTELIPYIDITSAGNFRSNNYLESTAPGTNVRDEVHFLTRTAGVEQLNPGEGTVSTFTVTNYPANSTGQSRTFQIDVESYDENGNLRQAGHIANIDIPNTNITQARQTIVEPVPIAFGNIVNVTLSYETRVVGNDMLIDFRMVSSANAAISGVRLTNVATLLSYTSAATTTRTDRWVNFTSLAGTYIFSGEAEFLISFQPFFDGNVTSIVAVVRESDGTVVQLNDNRTLIPETQFSSVEIPDTIDFRTLLADHYFRHADLAGIIPRSNTQWVYGLALLRDISEFRITGELDFSSFVLVGTVNSTRVRVTLDDTNVADLKFNLEEI